MGIKHSSPTPLETTTLLLGIKHSIPTPLESTILLMDDGVDQVQIPDHVGLVAQEVQLTDLAEMVFEDRDGYLNIDNTKLTFALVNAVKELKQELDDLRAKMPRS